VRLTNDDRTHRSPVAVSVGGSVSDTGPRRLAATVVVQVVTGCRASAGTHSARQVAVGREDQEDEEPGLSAALDSGRHGVATITRSKFGHEHRRDDDQAARDGYD